MTVNADNGEAIVGLPDFQLIHHGLCIIPDSYAAVAFAVNDEVIFGGLMQILSVDVVQSLKSANGGKHDAIFTRGSEEFIRKL